MLQSVQGCVACQVCLRVICGILGQLVHACMQLVTAAGSGTMLFVDEHRTCALLSMMDMCPGHGLG